MILRTSASVMPGRMRPRSFKKGFRDVHGTACNNANTPATAAIGSTRFRGVLPANKAIANPMAVPK